MCRALLRGRICPLRAPVDARRVPEPAAVELVPPRGVFLVARQAEKPVGCGALTTLSPGVGYLTRMWVAEAVRGVGLGRRLLAALEEWASRLGHDRVRLYTDRRLPEAQALYRRAGYQEVPPFFDDDAPFADCGSRGGSESPRRCAPLLPDVATGRYEICDVRVVPSWCRSIRFSRPAHGRWD